MRIVEAQIEQLQGHFAGHPFFVRMRPGQPYAPLRPMLEGLSFWVLGFHDILEQVEEAMVDPVYQRVARHHHLEEGGHDRWYVQDLRRLGIPLPDSQALFSRRHAGPRRASIRLLAEVRRCQSDDERLALLLALEATGAVFFTAAARYDGWPATGLQFFSGHHLEVEQAHQLFETRMRAWLRGIELDASQRVRVLEGLVRVFGAFKEMFDAFEAEASRVAQPIEAVA